MKKITHFRMHTIAFVVAFAVGTILIGCEKNLYDPNYGKEELPDPETLPDFSTRSTVSLNVDYEAPGFKTLVEVYTEYPYELNLNGIIVRKNINPIFAAYTDNNAKLTAQFELAADVKSIYLHCPSMGMPQCVALDVVNNKIEFKTSDLTTATETRGMIGSPAGSGDAPWKLEDKFSTLCQWDLYGKPKAPANYLNNVTGTQEMLKSIQHELWDGNQTKPTYLDNSKYANGSKYTNISIATTMKDDKGDIVPVVGATVKLTFLQEAAWYQNTFGYYYYPTDKVPASAAEVDMKFVAFPNLSTGDTPPYGAPGNGGLYYDRNKAPLSKNQQVTLLYTDNNGKVSESFPPGYTIGWFIIPDGFSINNSIGAVETSKGYLYSNEAWNPDGKKRCITFNYQNEKVVLGFEDGGDYSYEDQLFYAESDPKGAIINPDNPILPTPPEKPTIPDANQTTIGTYLFEDLWPQAGDYDMNDVMVEYKRVVCFNEDNMVTKIEDIFEPKQKSFNSSLKDAFAYQVDPSQVGSYTLPEGSVYEAETNSFLVFTNSRLAKGEYKIVREFKSGSFHKDQLKAYNPYIIVKYTPEDKQRIEVHLPKGEPTGYANKNLVGTGKDAYYIDKNGKYPFAIELPIHGFTAVTETKRIGTQDYPLFVKWAESGCTEYNDWYMHK